MSIKIIFLEKSILSTIVYYDVLGMPLTGFEVWKYLSNISRISHELPRESKLEYTNYDFLEVLNKLNESELKQFIESKNGFYFLKGRDNLYEQRIERKKIADQKWKKVRGIVKWFQIIPYVRMIAVSGSLAQNNTKPESDLDLMIVIKKGRIWTARAMITFLAALLGVRRHGSKTKDRICLNHYITDESLEIKFKSLYNAQTYAHMVCLIDNYSSPSALLVVNGVPTQEVGTEFQKANLWIKDYLYFYPPIQNQNQKFIKSNKILKSLAKFGEFLLDGKIGNRIEKFLKNIQLNHIERHPLRRKKGGRIVADDFQLEFHPDSPEKEILEKYNEKISALGFPEFGREKDSGLL